MSAREGNFRDSTELVPPSCGWRAVGIRPGLVHGLAHREVFAGLSRAAALLRARERSFVLGSGYAMEECAPFGMVVFRNGIEATSVAATTQLDFWVAKQGANGAVRFEFSECRRQLFERVKPMARAGAKYQSVPHPVPLPEGEGIAVARSLERRCA